MFLLIFKELQIHLLIIHWYVLVSFAFKKEKKIENMFIIQESNTLIKFIYSERTHQSLIWFKFYIANAKSIGRIHQSFLTFREYVNFSYTFYFLLPTTYINIQLAPSSLKFNPRDAKKTSKIDVFLTSFQIEF